MWMMRKRQCTWTKLWSLIEGGGDGLKMKKWEKLQKGVEKKHVFQFHMTMQNFCTVMRNGALAATY